MKSEIPLRATAQALLFAQLDAGPGITPRPPSSDAPTTTDYVEELLLTVERRAERILVQARNGGRRKIENESLPNAESALHLCSAVRNACMVGSPTQAAMAAMMAVSQLW